MKLAIEVVARPVVRSGVVALHGEAIPKTASLGRLYERGTGEKSSRSHPKNKFYRVASCGYLMQNTRTAKTDFT